ncbi:MAG: EpsG family protein [Oscillospiraceae bacterium]|jgi:transmembrane protein EpsG|nr:EpsG family protein [Oscillospiraceae bacterium]
MPLPLFGYLSLITAVCCLSGFLANQFPLRRRTLLGNEIPNPLGFLAPTMILLLLSGLRRNVGDTFFYRHSYLLFLDMGAPAPKLSFTGNILFGELQYLCSKLPEIEFAGQPQYGQLLIFLSALLFLAPAIFVLYKYSDSYGVSLFLFIATGVFMNSMNGIRQYAAAGLLLLGTKYFFAPKMWKGFLCFLPFCLLAWGIHSSALMMLPFFFLCRVRAFSVWSYLMVLGAGGAVLFSDLVMPNLLDTISATEYGHYDASGWFSSGEETGSTFLRAVASLAPVVLAYFFRERFRALGKPGDILVNLSFLLTAINILGVYNWIFVRLGIYFYVFHILLITKVYRCVKEDYGAVNLYTLGGLACYTYYGTLANFSVAEYYSRWIPWFAGWKY